MLKDEPGIRYEVVKDEIDGGALYQVFIFMLFLNLNI
jgi:hypothetical protein